MTGLPSTATHTIVVTYFTRFSKDRERCADTEEGKSWEDGKRSKNQQENKDGGREGKNRGDQDDMGGKGCNNE